MTTTLSPAASPTTGDARPTAPVRPLSFVRACAVELRKLVNTRAAAALIVGGVAGMAAFGVGRAAVGMAGLSFTRLVSIVTMPGAWLLLVLAALLVTGEFGHERAVATFTLDPRRGRVVAAKATVVALAGLALAPVSLAIAAVGNLTAPLFGATSVAWTLEPTRLAVVAGSLVVGALSAFAVGLATRNAPATIAVVLLWPTVVTILSSASPAAARLLAWVDPNPLWALLDGTTATVWAQVATSVLTWVVVPAAIGTWRLLRDDL